ncbi:MAG: Dabb family protein [Verrucomicrobiales bacterium]
MVHYIALFRLDKDKAEEEIEEMIRLSRSCLHRVNEAHNFRSGRSIEDDEEYGFFISADFENRSKLAMFREDPNYLRFKSDVVDAHTRAQRELLYETEPGKNPKYS